ncbi:MAG: serine/threonine-protein kinase [Planctomycetota bacterium]
MRDGALDEDVLVDYVSRALDMRERGEEPRLAELCRDHPELIDRVAAMLARAPKLAGFAARASGFDGLQGRVLAGRYRLDERLGAGAMGIVYRAFDTELARAVAVKVLRPELFGGPDAEKRFLREAEVLAALHHPNVVAVYDRGCTPDGVSFLVMELLTGQPLVVLLDEYERRKEGGPAALDEVAFVGELLGDSCDLDATWLRQAVRWTAELARGLAEAHRLGILHRDVKPSNVFIDHDGHARLLDFGVAASSRHATLTVGGESALGTPGYIAPEVITDQAPAAPAADIYGLAATLYHMLTRRPPYLGTVTHIIASVQRRDPIPVGKLRPGLPRDLHAIVDRAMARRVSERYASMAEFERDLRAFLNHQPVTARPLSLFDRAWRRGRRSPSARVAAAGVALLVLAGTVYEWRAIADRARVARYLDASVRLPPGLGLENPAFRAFTDDAERKAISALLDAAVADAAEPLPARVLRAAFLLDQGEPAAAADDLEALAEVEGTDLARALAERYRAAAMRGGRGHQALDLAGLPEPSTLHDRYLVAFHELRGGASATSNERDIQWFEAADPAWLPGQEMLASALHFKAKRFQTADPKLALSISNRALEVATRIEALRGRRSATTAQQIGSALLAQQRYAKAWQVLAEGCELCPWSNGLLRNLATAQRRAGDLEGAIATCERGIRLRPAFLPHYQALAQAWTDLGDYDRARAEIAAAPVADDAAGARLHHGLMGLTEYGIALDQLATEPKASMASAHAAMEHFVAAGETTRPEYAICKARASGNPEALFDLLLEQWAADPTSWLATGNLAHALPPTLDADAVVWLLEGLRRLAESQAPPRPITQPTSPRPSQAPSTLNNDSETAK